MSFYLSLVPMENTGTKSGSMYVHRIVKCVLNSFNGYKLKFVDAFRPQYAPISEVRISKYL